MFYRGMDNISFTSRIRLVPWREYVHTISELEQKNYAKYPWTIKESVLADKAYTTGIIDCTVCGLTDGKQVLLNHICPDMPGNANFFKIAKFIQSKMPLDNPNIQGFLLGSKKYSENSKKLFEKFTEFLNRHNVPFSQFKGGELKNDVAYISSKDEWLISNPLMEHGIKVFNSPGKLAKRMFDEVKLCDMDQITW